MSEYSPFAHEAAMRRSDFWWNLEGNKPAMRMYLKCAFCGTPITKEYRIDFFQREDDECKYYANVTFECSRCRFAWDHVVAVPARMYYAAYPDETDKELLPEMSVHGRVLTHEEYRKEYPMEDAKELYREMTGNEPNV